MQLSARDKEVLFSDLAELVRTGMTFRDALEKIARHASRLRGTIAVMLTAGAIPEACFNAASSRFDEVDMALVSAGVESGRLDQAFSTLGEYYATIVQCRKQFSRGLYYPLAMFHLGVLLLDLPVLFTVGMGTYLRNIFCTFFIFYFVFIGAYFVFRYFQDSVRNNISLQRRVRFIPLLGRLPYQLALWRFSLVASLLTASGLGIFRALEVASRGCHNALIRSSVAEIIVASRNSVPLGDAFAKTGAFPEEIVRFVSLGDSSGRMDEELHRAAKVIQKDFSDLVLLLSKFVPKLIYAGIILFFAIRMIQTMQGITSQMQGLLDM